MSRTLCAVSEVVRGLPLPLREGVGGGVRAARTSPPNPLPQGEGEALFQRRQRVAIRQVDSRAVAAIGIQIARQGNARVRCQSDCSHAPHRIVDDRFFRHRCIDQPMHETGIGPVLQQTPHKIGQQVLVRADRGIYAHRTDGADNAVIQRLAHAVQALHFEFSPGGVFQHECQAVRVMRSEGRFDGIGRSQHVPRIGEPANIGRRLAGEHRILGVALHLCELDFGVPIRTFHQPHRNAMRGGACQRGNPVHHRRRALLVRLHRQTQPVPTHQPRICQHRGENIEAEFQAVGFFRIHREADAVLLCCQRQRA